MNTIEIAEKDMILEFPENGMEFTKEQFLSFSKNMMRLNSKAITFEQFKVRLTYDFLNLKRTTDAANPTNQQLVENILSISRLTENYFVEKREAGKPVRVLDMVFFTQLLPSLKVGSSHFFGPDSALINTVYGEYLQALTAFVDYSRTGEESHLDAMIATLYRPKKWFYSLRRYLGNFKADKRRSFNPDLTDHYAKKLKKLAPEVKHAIYLFFASCQHFIANNDALEIGGGNTIDLTILFKHESTGASAKGLGMVGTLYMISESKVFGNVKEVADQNTYDVLAYLVDQFQRAKKSKTKP